VLVTSLSGATRATIDSSSASAGTDPAIDTSGHVVVTAASRPHLLTIAASGVMSGENALSTALVFNDLTGRSVSALITGTDARRANVSASRGVSVTAREESSLLAVSGQVAIPASTSAAVAAGAAGTVNDLGVDVTAAIEHATVTTTGGDVTVQTVTGGEIKAWAVGVSGALSGNSGGGVMGSLPLSFVGAGSFALNTVVRRDIAAVRGKASVTAKSLSVTAEDAGGIFAVAGALAVQVSGKTVSLAVGVSVADNEIGTADSRGLVKAVIDDASVSLKGGDATVTATAKPAITSWTIAGTGQVSNGKGAAVGLSGAGAGNTNTLAIDTLAAIIDSESVTTDKGVRITASDASKVDANAGGAGLGVTLGSSAAVGVTVGAARSVVTVKSTVRAAVESSTVSAGGDVSLRAESKQTLSSLGFGVAINVAAGGSAGVSVAGSGAFVSTTLATASTAEVLSSTVTAGTVGTGSVAIGAFDEPSVTSDAGAGSLSIAVGYAASVGVAPGLVIAEATLGNRVAARIGTAEGSTRLPVITAAGLVDVEALSGATIDSFSATVTGAFSVSMVAVAGAVSVTVANDSVANTVTAEIASGSVTGGEVDVHAASRHAVSSTVRSGAVSASMFAASVGVSSVTATVDDVVSATIGTAAVTATGGDISVSAGASSTIDSHARALAVAIGLGGAGVGSPSTSKDISRIAASVQAGATLSAPIGSVNLVVGGDADGGKGSVSAVSDGGSVGMVAAGAALATAEHSQTRLATVGDGVSLAGAAKLVLDAGGFARVKAESYAVDVGVGLVVQVNMSTATSGGSVKAVVGSNVTLPAVVSVRATGGTTFDVLQGGGFGGLIGAGSNFATATTRMTVEATLGDGAIAAAGKRVDRL
jgi:hypothetical protein